MAVKKGKPKATGMPKFELVELGALKRWPKNPKNHDLDFIREAFDENGMAEFPTIDEGTGRMVAGHGRLETLEKMKADGDPPPARVEVRGGKWFVPVVRGMTFPAPGKHVLASNRGVELGGWDNALLAAALGKLGAEDLVGTGFGEDDLAQFLAGAGGGEGGDDLYTKKIQAPIYEPKGEKPPVSELCDLTKTEELLGKIRKAKLPDEVRTFLALAAHRHAVFDYEKIAEFYAHAPKDMQRLFEDSALVIIDFKKAIEGGFVVMTEEIAEGYPADEATTDEAA